MNGKLNRRKFINVLSVTGTGIAAGLPTFEIGAAQDVKPALLGGPRAHPGGFPGWPVFGQREEEALVEVLRSKYWGRLSGDTVADFEQAFAKKFGTRHCLGVSSGTTALYTLLGALDIGPGDEVIIPVYTFVATYNVVVLNYALPVFVDTDIETFQIDASKIAPAITPQTKVIMPVHIGGSPSDMDTIMEVARDADIPLIEDACQAHLASWKGKPVGGLGLAGAFSFQSSKNLNCGEGGAIITNDEEFAQSCYRFHNQGQGGRTASYQAGSGTRATNARLTEFQGGLLLAQMARLEAQSKRRSANAAYLTSMLEQIPGISPAKLYEGTTDSAYHLYMFRFDKNHFAGMDRSQFLKAMAAEGVPCSSGYGTMNKDAYVRGLAEDRHYLNIYGRKTMQEWLERNQCPQNDILAGEQAVWFTQTMLLGERQDMDQIVEAIKKIQKHAGEIASA
ncbi:MAG TPA: DegT/DnrJ/EryC1/StrS family aminotransferase [Cyclobacteriaceae bacterium]|nr:DegT/DnrJ/EryC1/StrS family aminotransferase [Cyclobacteriaceae bacterium]